MKTRKELWTNDKERGDYFQKCFGIVEDELIKTGTRANELSLSLNKALKNYFDVLSLLRDIEERGIVQGETMALLRAAILKAEGGK